MNKITKQNGTLLVPDKVVIPFIEGDGVGAEITPVCQRIVDEAVGRAYGGQRVIEWKEVLAGEKAFKQTGSWLPDETMEAFREYMIGIKGPLTTPIGGGIRSLNVALRQTLEYYDVIWSFFYIILRHERQLFLKIYMFFQKLKILLFDDIK